MSYDAHPFTGRVVRVSVRRLGITQDGYVIGRVRRTIDVGRPDPIVRVDPDMAMAEEPWDPDKPVDLATRLPPLVRTYLEEHGPSSVQAIADAIHESYWAVQQHLGAAKGKLYQREKVGRARLWGLLEKPGATSK